MKFLRHTRTLIFQLITNPEIFLDFPKPILPHPYVTENLGKQAKWARKSHSLFSLTVKKNISTWYKSTALYGKHSVV